MQQKSTCPAVSGTCRSRPPHRPPRRATAAIHYLVLLPALLIEGCICGDGVNTGDVNIVSLDQEWELGRQLADEIRQQAPVLDDVLVQEYLNRMGSRIVEVTERNDRPWTFHLVADTSINAFNIPGGHVFVNSGLIAAAETPDELAGVLSHEVAHGVARHATEQMTQAYGLNLVARLVLGGDVNLLEQIAAQLIGTGAMAKFSRDDERESDQLGLAFMSDAGYDPNAMARMFERMLAIRHRRPNMLEQFFSTHPLTEERIDDVTQRANEMEPPEQPVKDPQFTEVRARAEVLGTGDWR